MFPNKINSLQANLVLVHEISELNSDTQLVVFHSICDALSFRGGKYYIR